MRVVTKTVYLQDDNYRPEDSRLFVDDDSDVSFGVTAAEFRDLGSPEEIIVQISVPMERV